MAEIQCLEQFEDIEAHVVVDEPWVKRPEICVVHILKDQRGCLALTVSHHVQQCHDIRTAGEVLQDLDFTLYLLLLDRFEYFDDAFLVVDNINAFEDLGIFASSYGLVSMLSFCCALPVIEASPIFRTIS